MIRQDFTHISRVPFWQSASTVVDVEVVEVVAVVVVIGVVVVVVVVAVIGVVVAARITCRCVGVLWSIVLGRNEKGIKSF